MKKKGLLIAAAFLLFAVCIVGFGAVGTAGPWFRAQEGDFCEISHRGHHRGFLHKNFGEFILWRMDKRVSRLDLTGEQEEKYDRFRSGIEAHLGEGLAERQRLREVFRTEIAKENPDVRFLANTVKEKMTDFSAFFHENLDLFVEFYEALNPDQRDRVLEAVRERMDGNPA